MTFLISKLHLDEISSIWSNSRCEKFHLHAIWMYRNSSRSTLYVTNPIWMHAWCKKYHADVVWIQQIWMHSVCEKYHLHAIWMWEMSPRSGLSATNPTCMHSGFQKSHPHAILIDWIQSPRPGLPSLSSDLDWLQESLNIHPHPWIHLLTSLDLDPELWTWLRLNFVALGNCPYPLTLIPTTHLITLSIDLCALHGIGPTS